METITTTDAAKRSRTCGLVNRAAVKRFALDYAHRTRAQKFSRVSDELVVAAEAALRRFLTGTVNCHPSKGKTLYPMTRVGKHDE